jgi:hypothetical protein
MVPIASSSNCRPTRLRGRAAVVAAGSRYVPGRRFCSRLPRSRSRSSSGRSRGGATPAASGLGNHPVGHRADRPANRDRRSEIGGAFFDVADDQGSAKAFPCRKPGNGYWAYRIHRSEVREARPAAPWRPSPNVAGPHP